MISAPNITLKHPTITYKSRELLSNPEVHSLLVDISDYFSQTNVIYHAELVLSNNDYDTIYGEFGKYKKRRDFSFRMIELSQVVLYDGYIDFIVDDGCANNTFRVKVGKDFFYFFEWESSYYD